MKSVITSLIIFASFSASASANYSCAVAADPENGIQRAFEIVISPAAEKGEMTMIQNGKEKSLGEVTQVQTMLRDKKNIRVELWATGLAEVAGLNQEGLNSLTSIRVLKAKTRKDEHNVYQLLVGEEIVGGVLAIKGKLTSCVPQN